VIWLARHGQTAYNHARRFQGHLPVPLDDTGREQARALAREAAGRDWAALWCSPLERALETARIVGEAIDMEPRPDARFAETDCGDWTDRPFDEVEREDPERFRRFITADPGFAFPGGESFAQQGERIQQGLDDVRAGALPALVVCHRGVMRLALTHARGARLSAIDVPNASLVELGRYPRDRCADTGGRP
jgi:broad specificity phosphatase PhoE